MVLSEPEGLLRIAIVDLETAWGFWLQQAVEDAHRRIFLASLSSRSSC